MSIIDIENIDRCYHGCYPVNIDTIRKIARADELKDIKDKGLEKQLKNTIGLNRPGGPGAAEEFIIKNDSIDEPYVGLGDYQRKVIIKAGQQGPPFGVWMSLASDIGDFGYDLVKVAEDFVTQPGSQLHQEMQQREQRAQQQINQSLSGIEDLFKKKQLLEHDLRKLESKQEHFEDEKEEALKADFVDNVDQHTGRNSIVQMQANNIFPSIIPDFYSMTSLEDLSSGHLSKLPEQEKSVLRKKYMLYEKWKEKFGSAINSKVKDVQRRLRSVERSIEQAENFIKPYVETLRVIQGDFNKKLDFIKDTDMYIGHSSSKRIMKFIGTMDLDSHKDVLTISVTHVDLAAPSEVQSPANSPSAVVMDLKEFLVCDHVYNEVFKPQIDERKHEVERFVKEMVGDEVDTSKKTYTEQFPEIKVPSDYKPEELPKSHQTKINFLEMLGLGRDSSYKRVPEDIRKGLIGPKYPTGFWINFKIDNGLNIMK